MDIKGHSSYLALAAVLAGNRGALPRGSLAALASSNVLGRVGAGRRTVIFTVVAVVLRRRGALAAVVVLRRVLLKLGMSAVVVVAALFRRIGARASIRMRRVGRAVTRVLLRRRVSVA